MDGVKDWLFQVVDGSLDVGGKWLPVKLQSFETDWFTDLLLAQDLAYVGDVFQGGGLVEGKRYRFRWNLSDVYLMVVKSLLKTISIDVHDWYGIEEIIGGM